MATFKQINILKPGKLVIKKIIPIKDLVSMKICQSNAIMLSLHTKNKYDVLIESYKRFEIIRFILQVFEQEQLHKIKLISSKK